uniref:Type VI secretion system n=1 Tax=Ganoderma boninense TaxID=34458 RepID=A0A5K1K3X4_9APHY|nr:Type VI secretion system [Ganoderma boninense]
MAPNLPQELIDEAIDYLWNDRKALAACALACHACLHSARTHLFHGQRLIGAKSCSRFESFLEHYPDLAKYIRKLSLTEPSSSVCAQDWFNRIPDLVAKLEKLATLELIGLHYVSLHRCPKETLAAFAKLTNLVFADVYFDHFLDVHTLLASAHNITDICFYRVGWGNASPAYEDIPGPSPLRLKRLVVDSWATSAMLRQWLLPSAELGDVNIRTLMVRWRERDSIDVLNSLFRVCGPALENLYIELPTTIEGAQEVPTLHHNTNLHALEIDGVVLPGCVELARALLDSLCSTQLKKLSISMLVLRNDVLATFDWAQLDAILARPQFAETALAITVNRALHPHNDAEAFRKAVREHLPEAVRRGKLTIRCS